MTGIGSGVVSLPSFLVLSVNIGYSFSNLSTPKPVIISMRAMLDGECLEVLIKYSILDPRKTAPRKTDRVTELLGGVLLKIFSETNRIFYHSLSSTFLIQ